MHSANSTSDVGDSVEPTDTLTLLKAACSAPGLSTSHQNGSTSGTAPRYLWDTSDRSLTPVLKGESLAQYSRPNLHRVVRVKRAALTLDVALDPVTRTQTPLAHTKPSLKVPGSQGKHDAVPRNSAKVPSGQLLQELDRFKPTTVVRHTSRYVSNPQPAVCCPASQSSQDDKPEVGANVPGGHGVQLSTVSG